MEPSLFTKIINGDIPASFVAKGDTWVAFLDIFPRRPGHTLVIPIEQKQYIADLSPESTAGLMEGVVEVQRRLGAHFDTTDFGVGVHDGPLAGQEVPHVHVHVVPRTEGDGGLTLLACWPDTPPPGSTDPDFAALAELSEQLQALE
ncbi:MAG: HIT family protein [Methanobacteriota archaeon]|nr:MAG: HIT family protein [Euryarchaeota archaeon]